MAKALSENRFDAFLERFIEGETTILKAIKKVSGALRNLEPIPGAMKLLFGALSATERAYLIMGGEHKTEELWIFTYFDPEAVYKWLSSCSPSSVSWTSRKDERNQNPCRKSCQTIGRRRCHQEGTRTLHIAFSYEGDITY